MNIIKSKKKFGQHLAKNPKKEQHRTITVNHSTVLRVGSKKMASVMKFLEARGWITSGRVNSYQEIKKGGTGLA